MMFAKRLALHQKYMCSSYFTLITLSRVVKRSKVPLLFMQRRIGFSVVDLNHINVFTALILDICTTGGVKYIHRCVS